MKRLGADLRVGLPRQAVLGDGRTRHEPMRLLVVARAPVVKELVDGRWVHLVARDGGAFCGAADPAGDARRSDLVPWAPRPSGATLEQGARPGPRTDRPSAAGATKRAREVST